MARRISTACARTHPEYHDVFLLGKNELGCTNTIKHKIEIDDSEPFKEHF